MLYWRMDILGRLCSNVDLHIIVPLYNMYIAYTPEQDVFILIC